MDERYVPKMQPSNSEYSLGKANHEFSFDNLYHHIKFSPAQNCLDLTPFVREASLPEIAPANGEQI